MESPPSQASQEPPRPVREIADSAPNGAATYAATAAVEPGEGMGDLELIVERWDNIRMDVKALNRRTEALLQQADPVHFDGSQLTLVAAYPFHQKRLNDDDTRRVIEEVIERQVGRKMTILCVSREEAQALRGNASSPPPQSQQAAPPNAGLPATPREPGPSRSTSPAREDDDTEPDPADLDAMYNDDQFYGDYRAASSVSTLEIDEERIKAAMNIFDAVIVDEEA